MIFAFLDDGTLWILEGEADAQGQFEGIDVESGVVHFYDESGTYLEPRFSVPNRTGKWLGILSWVESGAFHLVPNPSAEHDSFALALYETAILLPNRRFSSLEELKAALSKRGVEVELPGSGR